MENVLTIERSLFERLGVFQGISMDIARYAEILRPENHIYVPRNLAEEDETKKQIIPYILVRKGNCLVRYIRGKKGSEARLHGRTSIGAGGHLNDEDGSILEGILRELREELELQKDPVVTPVAIINDDSNEVGRVHLAIVYLVDIPDAKLKTKDAGIVRPTFVEISTLLQETDRMENWSKLCMQNIDALLSITPTALAA